MSWQIIQEDCECERDEVCAFSLVIFTKVGPDYIIRFGYGCHIKNGKIAVVAA